MLNDLIAFGNRAPQRFESTCCVLVMQLSIVLDSGRGEGASAREFIECVGRDFLGFGQRVCLGAVLGASGEEV